MLGEMVATPDTTMLEQVISFTESRHRVLANNIANIDTPNYKVTDLDLAGFRQDLREAADRRRAGRHDGGQYPPKVDTQQYLLFHDRNNRSIEKQMSAITQNAMLHNVAVELLRHQYQLLQRVIALKP